MFNLSRDFLKSFSHYVYTIISITLTCICLPELCFINPPTLPGPRSVHSYVGVIIGKDWFCLVFYQGTFKHCHLLKNTPSQKFPPVLCKFQTVTINKPLSVKCENGKIDQNQIRVRSILLTCVIISAGHYLDCHYQALI